MNEFGKKIKKIRTDRGLTQQQFADSLGYAHKSTINKIESGQEDMSYQKILILLKEYMLNAQDLFDVADEEVDKIEQLNNKCSKRHDKCIIYIHGLYGNAKEAEFYSFLNKEYDVIGLEYADGNPWEVKSTIVSEFIKLTSEYKTIYLIGNSIGAFYACMYLDSFNIKAAFFISPFVNMKNYIETQLRKNKFNLKQFEKTKIIELPDKQILSYDFYQSLLNKDNWKIKTYILYGEKDNIVDKDSIFDFVSKHNACLSIMKNAEHYFHTPSQLRFIKKWITEILNK